MKRVKKEKTYSFSVLLTPEPEGGFTVTVPFLPEVVTYGRNVQEALEYARECIDMCVEMRLEEGMYVGGLNSSLVSQSR